MRRFNEEALDAQAKSSPNHMYGLVLTSRGLLESNQIQSTLWLVDLRKLRAEFHNDAMASTFRPISLAVVAAIPKIDARGTGAYGSVIFSVRWSSDSRKIYFSVKAQNGNRRLYTVSVVSRVVKP